jgi:hypothetical protein
MQMLAARGQPASAGLYMKHSVVDLDDAFDRKRVFGVVVGRDPSNKSLPECAIALAKLGLFFSERASKPWRCPADTGKSPNLQECDSRKLLGFSANRGAFITYGNCGETEIASVASTV